MKYSLRHVDKTYHHWGRHPLFYKLACIITFLGKQNKLRKETVSKLNLKPGGTVLDLACGTGLNFQFIQKQIGPTGKIIAFDYSPDMLAAAQAQSQKQNWQNLEFIQGDAAELKIDRPVDAIISTLGISAIPQHGQALQKAVTSLKPDGRIAILDAQLPTGIWQIFNPLIKLIYKHWASWNYTKNIPKDLKKLLPNMQKEEYNGGTIYIVWGQR